VLLNRLHVLILTEHATRRMHPGGITARPAGDWTAQQARNLAMNPGERPGALRFSIRDRGSNFTPSLDAVFPAAATTILRTAAQAPRTNAICERPAGTPQRKLLDRSLILGEPHLRAVLAEYQEHHNPARPHQGIDQRIPHSAHHPPRLIPADLGISQNRRKPALSGLINEYDRAAQHPRSRSSRPRILFSSGTGWCRGHPHHP
jgi:putative transposase